MHNQSAAVHRRLSDPDFQGSVVRLCLLAVVAMAAVVVVALAHDAYVWTHPPSSKYFRVDGKTLPRPMTALDSPIVDDDELLQWAVKWMLAPYNVNYHDFPQQLNTAGRHYTPNGWNSFAAAYVQGGNFEEMKRARLLCYAQAQRAAVIRQTKVVAGRLAYEIQLPAVQTCENTNQATSQNLLLTALVVRTDDEQAHPDGHAIDQLVARAF